MVIKKATGKKLKIKKETIKDLNVKGKAAGVKGGVSPTKICHSGVKFACNITDL